MVFKCCQYLHAPALKFLTLPLPVNWWSQGCKLWWPVKTQTDQYLEALWWSKHFDFQHLLFIRAHRSVQYYSWHFNFSRQRASMNITTFWDVAPCILLQWEYMVLQSCHLQIFSSFIRNLMLIFLRNGMAILAQPTALGLAISTSLYWVKLSSKILHMSEI
jgi:hypothetical protein